MESLSSSPVSDSPSCRILILSSSLERNINLVQRIQALSKSTKEQTGSPSPSPLSPPNDSPSSPPSTRIPWTISNKYYRADVHFQAHTIKGLAPHQLRNAPALIYVWEKGHTYKHHIHRLSQDLNDSEPEISLAVRIPYSSSRSAHPAASSVDENEHEEEEIEEPSIIDDFLSSHGFEFVDAASETNKADPEEEDGTPYYDGIPSFPRILDALSTIMWPSMEAATRSKPQSSAREAALLDWAQSSSGSFDISDDDLVVPRAGGSTGARRRLQNEMTELARWLEDGDEAVETTKPKDDPWRAAVNTSKGIVGSPTEMEFGDRAIIGGEQGKKGDEFGFEDDFTIFVSAPAASSSQERKESAPEDVSGRSTPTFGDSSFDDSFDGLAPSHAGVAYHSLGSMSDLGDYDSRVPKGTASDDDEGIPTEEEIRDSADRIFGLPPPLSRTQTAKPPPNKSESTDLPETFAFDEDEDSSELASFDLSRVLGALQGMKDEIANMDDEAERRRAAAKVALGLVYGLERDSNVATETKDG